jgi:hypothetical protein
MSSCGTQLGLEDGAEEEGGRTTEKEQVYKKKKRPLETSLNEQVQNFFIALN